MAVPLMLAGFPNPADWAVDPVEGFVGGAAAHGFQVVVGSLTAWVLDAVVWVVGAVFGFFLEATDPDVQADWFVGGDGPYATTTTIGATLLVAFLLVGITQGVLAGDVGGMLRRVCLELPMAVVGMVGLVALTQALIAVTDQLSRGLLSRHGDDVGRFTAAVGSLSGLGGGTASGFVVLLLALVSVLAGVVLVAELVIRGALIYIVVALAPLVFAAQLWPTLRGAGRRLLELLVALVVSKLVVAVALAVAAAGAGSRGELSGLPPPEAAAQDPGGSVTQAVGVLLAATAAFGVAAFSPMLVARLLPLTEAALVASGVRGAPLRAGQQALSASRYAHLPGPARLSSLASVPPAAEGATGSGAAAGGATRGGAAGSGAGVGAAAATAGARVAGAGVRAATSSVGSATSQAPSDRPGRDRAGRQPGRPGDRREGNRGRRG
jgi:hypothetical protein